MPKQFDQVESGSWKARALVRDKKNSKSHIVNLDIQAQKLEKLRLDVSSNVGIHVASLVMKGDEVKYALVRQKRFYLGKVNSRVLRPMISVPMSPQYLHNIVFELPIASKNWSCTKDDKGFLQECRDLSSGLKITWKERSGSKRVVVIDHKLASIQMKFHDYSPSVESPEKTFSLKTPKGFKRYRLR